MKTIQITDNEYPKRLLEIKNPPEKLYVKGNIDLLNKCYSDYIMKKEINCNSRF